MLNRQKSASTRLLRDSFAWDGESLHLFAVYIDEHLCGWNVTNEYALEMIEVWLGDHLTFSVSLF